MKKMRKIISLIVALAFLFSIAAPAMAAEPTAAEKAGARLVGLKIVEGFPGGDLKLNNDITRAELTVILARIAGLESAAELLKDTPSKFSDVKTGEWYTGWVNLAAAQGWVKGDPQGTFRPNDPVAFREVVTVLLKILGYNDNLPGDWPLDYLVKAADLGITKDINVDAKAKAVRGVVFQLTSRTLDKNVVVYNKDNDSFDEKDGDTATAGIQPVTLLSYKLDGTKVEDKIITDIKVGSTKKVTIDGADIKLASDATITGADFYSVTDVYVDYTYIVDDGVKYIKSIEVKPYGTQTATEAKLHSDSKVEINGTKYELASGVTLPGGWSFPVSGYTKVSADYIRIALDKDGKIGYIKKEDYTVPAIVKEISANGLIRVKNAGGQTIPADLNKSDVTKVVIKDGKEASLNDLKENDVIYIYTDRGVNYFIEAFSAKVNGKLTSIATDSSDNVTEVTIGGKSYKVENSSRLSDNGGKDFINIIGKSSTLDNYFDKEVVAYLSKAGKVQMISASDVSADSMYGVVVQTMNDVYSGGEFKDFVKILKADGTYATYEVTSDSAAAARTLVNTTRSNVDALVKYTLDSKGAIGSTFTMYNTDSYDYALKFLSSTNKNANIVAYDSNIDADPNGTYVATVASDVAVFTLKDDGDDYAKTTTWATLKDYIGTSTAKKAYAVIDEGKISAIAVFPSETVTTSASYAAVLGRGYNADGYYLKLDIDGTEQVYNVASGASIKDENSISMEVYQIDKGDLISYKVSNGKLTEVMQYVDRSVDSITKVVNDVKASDNMIKIENVWYSINNDTVLYDLTNDTPAKISLDQIFADDKVEFKATQGLIEWIVVKN